MYDLCSFNCTKVTQLVGDAGGVLHYHNLKTADGLSALMARHPDHLDGILTKCLKTIELAKGERLC